MANKRLKFLKDKFNVLTQDEFMALYNQKLEDGLLNTDKPLPIFEFLKKENSTKVKYATHINHFNNLLDVDPTKHKMYVQWLLNQSINLLRRGEFEQFITEDLEKTKLNLELFEANKRKKRFKEKCNKNSALKKIKDVSDINSFTVEELGIAVFPFKERVNVHEFELLLENLVKDNEGEIPVKDELITVFIPKTQKASEAFKFTNWCTSIKNGSMFKHYKTKPNYRRYDGEESDLYIIIDNGFFTGDNERVYQLHIESKQLRDKKDKLYYELFEDYLTKSLSLRAYLFEILLTGYDYCMNNGKTDLLKNYSYYIDQFRMGDVIIEAMKDEQIAISLKDSVFLTPPKFSRFTRVMFIYLQNVGLTEIDESIKHLDKLELLSVPHNKIGTLDDSLSECKSLRVINLYGNNIVNVAPSIKMLDPTNGGSLVHLTISKSKTLYNKLKTLLPTVEIIECE
jgi:hypothetical protein